MQQYKDYYLKYTHILDVSIVRLSTVIPNFYLFFFYYFTFSPRFKNKNSLK